MAQQMQVFNQIESMARLMKVQHLQNTPDFCIVNFENEPVLKCPELFRYGQAYYELVINLTDTCSFMIENDVIKPVTNTITLIKPWQLQSSAHYDDVISEEPAKGYIIYFSPSYLDLLSHHKPSSIFDRNLVTSFSLADDQMGSFQSLASSLYHEYINYHHQFSEKVIRNYLEIFLLKLQQHHTLASPSVTFSNASKKIYYNFLEAVNSNFTSYVTIKEYAQLLSITPKHLSETVKIESGKNALSIVDDARINYAKILLRQTEKSVKEIAIDLNFDDANNFSSYFKRHTQLTPTGFRKK